MRGGRGGTEGARTKSEVEDNGKCNGLPFDGGHEEDKAVEGGHGQGEMEDQRGKVDRRKRLHGTQQIKKEQTD